MALSTSVSNVTDSAPLCTGVHLLCLRQGASLQLLPVSSDPVGQVHAHNRTRRVQGRAVPSWLGACACLSTLAIVSRCVWSLSLLFFHLPPPKALRALLHPSSAPPHPVCHQLWAQTGRACCKAVKAAPLQFAAGLHRCSTHKLPLRVSPLPPVWAPGGLPGPLRRRGSRTLSLLRSPGALVSLQDLTADTHGFDNKERVKDMVKEKC